MKKRDQRTEDHGEGGKHDGQAAAHAVIVAGDQASAGRRSRRLEVTQSVSTVITAWLIAGILLLGLLGYELIDPTLRIGWAISIAVMVAGAAVPLPLGGFFGLVGMVVFAAQLMLRTWAGFQEGLGAWETALLLPLLALPIAAIRSQGAHLEQAFGAVRRMEAQASEVVNRYTGLPGPKLAPRFAAMVLAGWKRYGRRGALIEVQITNLDAARDLMNAADFLREMNELADAIRRHLRESDVVLHPSDQRIWVMTDLTSDPSGYAAVGQRLEPVAEERPALQIGVRIARFPDDGEAVEDLERALAGSAQNAVQGFEPYALGAAAEAVLAADGGLAEGAWPVWDTTLRARSYGREFEAPIGDTMYAVRLGVQVWQDRLAAVLLEWPAQAFESPEARLAAVRRLRGDLVTHYAAKIVARNELADDGTLAMEVVDADGNRLVATADGENVALAYVSGEFVRAIEAPPQPPEPAADAPAGQGRPKRSIRY
ncbi:MAG: hypothetical protein ACYDAB_12840 [bacterium]